MEGTETADVLQRRIVLRLVATPGADEPYHRALRRPGGAQVHSHLVGGAGRAARDVAVAGVPVPTVRIRRRHGLRWHGLHRRLLRGVGGLEPRPYLH
jgi:hypothetical protein